MAIVIAVILIASLRTFAVFYTDALWFSSVSLHSVWVKLFEIKFGLMVVFALIFVVMLMASLLVAERLAPKGPSLDAEDEFVKRYQEVIGPYARWLRLGVVVILSLIIGSQAIGQWNNWILFRSTPFAATDPQFHRNVAYFVFTLPFEQFLVHWTLVALVMVLLVTLLTHYLNGGIRMQGPRPRVRPRSRPTSRSSWGCWPWSRRSATTWPVSASTSRAMDTTRVPTTQTSTPGFPPSNCSSWSRRPRRSCSSKHPASGLGPAHPRCRMLFSVGGRRRPQRVG